MEKESWIIKLFKRKNVGKENAGLDRVSDPILANNENLKDLELPNLSQVTDPFLTNNENIKDVKFPTEEEIKKRYEEYIDEQEKQGNVENVNDNVLNSKHLPQLENTDFLNLDPEQLKRLNLPDIENIDTNFLTTNELLGNLNLSTEDELLVDFSKLRGKELENAEDLAEKVKKQNRAEFKLALYKLLSSSENAREDVLPRSSEEKSKHHK